ncbi:MAG: flagellar basal body L-ring protein FlgH [Pseudobdellovibrio sp.]
MKQSLNLFFLTSFLFFSGCATLKNWFRDDSKPAEVAKEEIKDSFTKYSDMENYSPVSDRQYKRMTREKMEEDSDLHAGAGSLWVMEGQTSYLFAQNKHRREGDPTQVKLEGSAKKIVEMKAETIKDLLVELENQKKQEEEKIQKAEQEKQRLADVEKEKQVILSKKEADNDDEAQAMAEKRVADRKPASLPVAAKLNEKEDKLDLKDVENIPVKITEKLNNGLYRVSGQQYLTIKNRPYKLIATGLVRTEDFNDESISSDKMYDSQYDIIHLKKGAQ